RAVRPDSGSLRAREPARRSRLRGDQSPARGASRGAPDLRRRQLPQPELLVAAAAACPAVAGTEEAVAASDARPRPKLLRAAITTPFGGWPTCVQSRCRLGERDPVLPRRGSPPAVVRSPR